MRHLFMLATFILSLVVNVESGFASLDTIGENGINSANLSTFDGQPLNGNGVIVGQVEDLRPGVFGYDNAGNSNSFVDPTSVYIQAGGGTTPDMNIGSGHATHVASVIISTDSTDSNTNGDAPMGIAPMAELHASAYVTIGGSVAAYKDNVLTTQFIANTVGAQIINHSSGVPKLATGDPNDGNSQLTLGLDWIASRYDVLNVVAGFQVGSTLPYPKDQFNGMTIGRSSKVGSVYSRVSSQNDYSQDATGERTSISLLAPGDNVEVGIGGDGESVVNGTSFATPHVTGTAVLLQQYANERIDNASSSQWDINGNARRHEVMKAVLMNSADKLIDDGTVDYPGTTTNIPEDCLLGMERTVVKQNGTHTWFQSEAFLEAQTSLFDTPLDDQMGVGHLRLNGHYSSSYRASMN